MVESRHEVTRENSGANPADVEAVLRRVARSLDLKLGRVTIDVDEPDVTLLKYTLAQVEVALVESGRRSELILIQFSVGQRLFRCICSRADFLRRGQRALRRLGRMRSRPADGAGPEARVFAGLGRTWVVHQTNEPEPIVRTWKRLEAAREAVWAEDLISVKDVRDQIPDEYDDLALLMVRAQDDGWDESKILEVVTQRVIGEYSIDTPGTAAAVAFADSAKRIVSDYFSRQRRWE
ncbi:hypothetical protein ARHIZOSPH14_15870 [Agromyces rhizosphaerae]|uniref:Uncharacterized protein n=1 Tax=Agromyces rhizosphaerae TaxID=88374 RepID=A0A9W6FPD2_9MICO|nr:hypothetical protein ARHIZOSPH14_15870 [Agromyces rhizosphaerae]